MIARKCLAAVAGLWFLGTTAASSDVAQQRTTFRYAEEALDSGHLPRFQKLSAQLVDYPLYPYLRRDFLLRSLSSGKESGVAEFIRDHAGAPYSRKIRGRWLRYLYERKRWSELTASHSDGMGVSMDCRYQEARYRQTPTGDTLDDAVPLWLSGRSQPKACDPLFALLKKQGRLTAAVRWRRFTLALESGDLRLAEYLTKGLSAGDREQTRLWFEAHKNPAATASIAARYPRSSDRTPDFVLHGIRRWGRQDAAAALNALDKMAEPYDLSVDKTRPLRRRLALILASSYDAEADRRLAELGSIADDPELSEWNVRVALKREDWNEVLKRIEAMLGDTRDRLQWKYWRARSLEQLGETERSRRVYREIAQNRDYHAFLAADRLGQPYQFRHQSLQVSGDLRRSLSARKDVSRARELVALKRYPAARLEWVAALKEASPEELRAAASLARDWGWNERAIATAARARDWDDLELRFPIDHRMQVENAASRDRLDPEWVFGVLRQESMFQPDARSHAGAMGLMQVMPGTAKAVARKLSLRLRTQWQLLEPNTNIRIGARYLRMSLDKLDDRVVLATAAYNAGPHRVRKWLPPSGESVAADIWVETVPFRETRRYLRKVLEYSAIYRHRLGVSRNGYLKPRMGPVKGVAKG